MTVDIVQTASARTLQIVNRQNGTLTVDGLVVEVLLRQWLM